MKVGLWVPSSMVPSEGHEVDKLREQGMLMLVLVLEACLDWSLAVLSQETETETGTGRYCMFPYGRLADKSARPGRGERGCGGRFVFILLDNVDSGRRYYYERGGVSCGK